MLEQTDKIFLLAIFLGVCYFYSSNAIKNYRINRFIKNATKADTTILHSIEEQGYNIIDVCPPKKIVYFKDAKSQVDLLDARLLVKSQGKKFLVERYSPNDKISLRDSFTKLKVISNFACYNVDGVLFINSKGEAIKECVLKITRERNIIYVLKKGLLFFLFTFLGFYISRTFL